MPAEASCALLGFGKLNKVVWSLFLISSFKKHFEMLQNCINLPAFYVGMLRAKLYSKIKCRHPIFCDFHASQRGSSFGNLRRICKLFHTIADDLRENKF